MAQPIEVIAFDLMDTLVRDPYREALSAAVDGDLGDLLARRDPDAYPAFERGDIDEDAYWATFAEAGVGVDPAAFHRVRLAGYTWLPGMRELLLALRDVDVRVVIASNYPYWIEALADGLLSGLVDHVHASCHLGTRKPAPEFYRGIADREGVDPTRMLFVDDRAVNVDAARAVGMQAVHFDGADTVRAGLHDVGVDVQGDVPRTDA